MPVTKKQRKAVNSARAGARKAASKRAAASAARRSPGKTTPGKSSPHGAARPLVKRCREALALLRARSTANDLANLDRFGITASKPLGVSMKNVQAVAKQVGRSHDLAGALWETGVYEARMLAAFVEETDHVTPAQMDRWCRDFDNWGICDTLCFCLFDRTPHAWAAVERWSEWEGEHQKRAAFALLASLALHDKAAPNAPFVAGLRLIEVSASDERNFVKKGVNWALRGIGRRNAALHKAAVAVARRLSDSPDAAPRWVGKDALRELTSPAVTRKLAAKRGKGDS